MQFQPLLIVENLCVRLKGRPVLNAINWEIRPGEQWAIMGPNGSGKTTLVKTLAGILPSSGGKIHFYPSPGKDRAETPGTAGIGFVSADSHRRVFERDNLTEEIRHFTGDGRRTLTALDLILDRSEGDRTYSSAHAAEMQALSDHLDMHALLEKKVGALTTGEISKTLILKALLNRPQLLILDEPYNGLDRSSRKTVAEFIGNLMRSGLQVILITHRVEEIMPEISHILVMTREGIQKIGRKDEVLQSDWFQQINRIHHEKTPSTAPPSDPVPLNLSKWGVINEVPEGTKLVEMVEVNVQYGRRPVLKNINWTICKGEHWMVSGPDGAGKTTLLKLITGENLQAYANDIYLFGQKKGSGESVWEIKQKIGWISSDLQSKYPVNIKGIEVVYSGFFDSVGLYRTATRVQRRQAEEVLAALGIDSLAKENYGNLSHGQKQMLLIARAIVKSPLLILLDEPCEGLDFGNRKKILEIIEFVGRHTPSAIVYATCDDDDVLPCMTHRFYLDRGSAASPF